MDYIVFWVVAGILAALIAKSQFPRAEFGGIVGDLIVGTAGAFLGGWLSSYPWIGSSLGALFGAFVLLTLLRLLFTKPRAT